ncbi:MAG: thioredoxin family protein [Acidimicrobiales bacterium]
MDVTLLYFDDCPNWKIADERLSAVAEELDAVTIHRQLVDTTEDAVRFGFRGSPSILVDGVDPFAAPDAPVGLSCRVYQTPDGPAGSPTVEQLREVLTVGERASRSKGAPRGRGRWVAAARRRPR